ncbi:uncharacterized protein LOC143213448 isoform X2 [Lasioglossum baleicum]|uniref:uncharacterized protein LOC143213448 isoform X2 n=1 Tax=Lasioglossum baleicum TaxID=434251 RepID=UPI003FCEC315
MVSYPPPSSSTSTSPPTPSPSSFLLIHNLGPSLITCWSKIRRLRCVIGESRMVLFTSREDYTEDSCCTRANTILRIQWKKFRDDGKVRRKFREVATGRVVKEGIVESHRGLVKEGV